MHSLNSYITAPPCLPPYACSQASSHTPLCVDTVTLRVRQPLQQSQKCGFASVAHLKVLPPIAHRVLQRHCPYPARIARSATPCAQTYPHTIKPYDLNPNLPQPHHALAPIHRLLINKCYIDHLCQWTIDRIALVLNRLISIFDRAVDGPALATLITGRLLCLTQTGQMQHYGAAIAAGAIALILLWWLALT